MATSSVHAAANCTSICLGWTNVRWKIIIHKRKETYVNDFKCPFWFWFVPTTSPCSGTVVSTCHLPHAENDPHHPFANANNHAHLFCIRVERVSILAFDAITDVVSPNAQKFCKWNQPNELYIDVVLSTALKPDMKGWLEKTIQIASDPWHGFTSMVPGRRSLVLFPLKQWISTPRISVEENLFSFAWPVVFPNPRQWLPQKMISHGEGILKQWHGILENSMIFLSYLAMTWYLIEFRQPCSANSLWVANQLAVGLWSADTDTADYRWLSQHVSSFQSLLGQHYV